MELTTKSGKKLSLKFQEQNTVFGYKKNELSLSEMHSENIPTFHIKDEFLTTKIFNSEFYLSEEENSLVFNIGSFGAIPITIDSKKRLKCGERYIILEDDICKLSEEKQNAIFSNNLDSDESSSSEDESFEDEKKKSEKKTEELKLGFNCLSFCNVSFYTFEENLNGENFYFSREHKNAKKSINFYSNLDIHSFKLFRLPSKIILLDYKICEAISNMGNLNFAVEIEKFYDLDEITGSELSFGRENTMLCTNPVCMRMFPCHFHDNYSGSSGQTREQKSLFKKSNIYKIFKNNVYEKFNIYEKMNIVNALKQISKGLVSNDFIEFSNGKFVIKGIKVDVESFMKEIYLNSYLPIELDSIERNSSNIVLKLDDFVLSLKDPDEPYYENGTEFGKKFNSIVDIERVSCEKMNVRCMCCRTEIKCGILRSKEGFINPTMIIHFYEYHQYNLINLKNISHFSKIAEKRSQRETNEILTGSENVLDCKFSESLDYNIEKFLDGREEDITVEKRKNTCKICSEKILNLRKYKFSGEKILKVELLQHYLKEHGFFPRDLIELMNGKGYQPHYEDENEDAREEY